MKMYMCKFWWFVAAASSAIGGQPRETWIVQEAPWKQVMEEAGITSDYAVDILSKLGRVQVVFDPDVPLQPMPQLPVDQEVPSLDSVLLHQDPEKKVGIYYAPQPRVRHHLWVVLERDVEKGLVEVSSAEALSLRLTVNKILTLLNTRFKIPHAVVAQWNLPQKNQPVNRFTLEILPARTPNEHDVLDKIESNNYVLRRGDLPHRLEGPTPEEMREDIEEWKEALAPESSMMFLENQEAEPQREWVQRQTNRQAAASEMLDWFYLALNRKQVPIQRIVRNDSFVFPNTQETQMKGCAFCREAVINSQKVYETDHSYVLYNFKPAVPEGHFLILPKRHVPVTEKLRADEVADMHELAQKLCQVIQEKTGRVDVSMYTQNGMSVGQTVDHTHLHVVLTPDFIFYALFSLNYEAGKPLTHEQMAPVIVDIHEKLKNLHK